MDILFLNNELSPLADEESRILSAIAVELSKYKHIKAVSDPETADVILIQERGGFKDFRYISELERDPIISRYPHLVYTINTDDCATGLLRGLYTSLPRSRFNPFSHIAVPYFSYPNEFIYSAEERNGHRKYLASWRGNTKSSLVRPKMMDALSRYPSVRLEATDSWLNHGRDEKVQYVDLILDAKFSLCPAGWAPVSFRIYESMALGRCPVILADEFVPPAGPDWESFALRWPEQSVKNLYSFLCERETDAQQLGLKAKAEWERWFSPNVIALYLVDALFTLLDDSPQSSRSQEMKRWRSLELFWSNRWTLPQRALNKARRWAKNH
jgi:hypothetical protein